MTTTFETAKAGDRVWSIAKGWGKIISIDYSSSYPLNVVYDSGEFDTYTIGGYLCSNRAMQGLFWDEVKIEAPKKPLPDLAVDAKVFVWGNGYEYRLKRHFSHFENGKLRAFDGGHTSWTGVYTSVWNNWELAE